MSPPSRHSKPNVINVLDTTYPPAADGDQRPHAYVIKGYADVRIPGPLASRLEKAAVVGVNTTPQKNDRRQKIVEAALSTWLKAEGF